MKKYGMTMVRKFEANDGTVYEGDFERVVNFDSWNDDSVFTYPRQHISFDLGEYSSRAREQSERFPNYPLPSLRCFSDAAEFACVNPFKGIKVVHAKLESGFHAWVETQRKMIESHWINGELFWIVFPKKKRFENQLPWTVLRQIKYSRSEIIKKVQQTGSSGPWERFMLEDITDKAVEHERLRRSHDETYRQLEAAYRQKLG